MRSLTPYVLSLLGAATTAFATYTGPADSDVVPLTQETFHGFMEEHELVLATFYAPWCRPSKELAPNLEEAAAALVNVNIPLAKVDCMLAEELCTDYGVGDFPTLKVFQGPNVYEPYTGTRQTESYATNPLPGPVPLRHANLPGRIIIYMMEKKLISTRTRPELHRQLYS